ncbi:MAG: dihydropteroate synthase [Pseudomonadota bacterium]
MFRPILQTLGPRPSSAISLSSGRLWFAEMVVHERGRRPELIPANEAPEDVLRRIVATRAPVCGLSLDCPRLMGILNVTPDSFSDGGMHSSTADAVTRAFELVSEGADLVDIGGESTRPGAETVPFAEELARVSPVLDGLREGAFPAPISIDTRKSQVAHAALEAGVGLINDVSALRFDGDMLAVARDHQVPLCLMHAQGDPETMQDAPEYEDVVIEIYEWFEALLKRCEAAGLPRSRLIVDPGIGFGKTLDHNLTLLRNLSIFHGLGCALLIGVSRKRFIGTLSGATSASDRMPGSIAFALEALRQGAQMIRMHDVRETRQAVAAWMAFNGFAQEAGYG